MVLGFVGESLTRLASTKAAAAAAFVAEVVVVVVAGVRVVREDGAAAAVVVPYKCSGAGESANAASRGPGKVIVGCGMGGWLGIKTGAMISSSSASSLSASSIISRCCRLSSLILPASNIYGGGGCSAVQRSAVQCRAVQCVIVHATRYTVCTSSMFTC